MVENKIDDTRRNCTRCHRRFSTNSFYKTYSELQTDNGYMPICKKCLYNLFLQFLKKYEGDTKKAWKRLCMLFDIYYSDNLFNSCDSDNLETIIGNYMKRLNMNQYKNKTFEDTMAEGFIFDSSDVQKKIYIQNTHAPLLKKPTKKTTFELAKEPKKVANETIKEIIIEKQPEGKLTVKDFLPVEEPVEEIRKKDIKRWGEGFELEDYKTLNDHYEHLINANPNFDSNQEIFIKDLCYFNMLKRRAIVTGNVDEAKKAAETYQKTFREAGLKTVEDTTNAEDFSMAVNVKTIEQYTPAEYYRDKKLYKDFDGIGEYFERFVLRPLRNLQHGSSDRDYEYYVKEESEYDG